MEARHILLKWQRYDPDTGRFDAERTAREFAEALGVAESYLSHIYSGRRTGTGARKPLLALIALFPAAAADVASTRRVA